VPQIPTEQTITPEWFNECFAAAGLSGGVSGLESARVGTGQMGKCVRYTFSLASRGICQRQ